MAARRIPSDAPGSRLADPLEAFTARCQARATLYANGEFDLHEAVDVLQDFAISLGLVESIGQDEVQRIMAEAFAPVRAAEFQGCKYNLEIEAAENVVDNNINDPADDYAGLTHSFARLCREADAQVDQEAINQRAREFHANIPLIAREGVPSAKRLQAEYEQLIQDKTERHGPAASTLDAAEYLARSDSKQFETWLLQRLPDERAAIMAYLQKKRDRA